MRRTNSWRARTRCWTGRAGRTRPKPSSPSRLASWTIEDIDARQQRAELEMLTGGITFTVYEDDAGAERIFPFSILPRVVAAAEWRTIEAG